VPFDQRALNLWRPEKNMSIRKGSVTNNPGGSRPSNEWSSELMLYATWPWH
jgi:hypothetical protein